MLDLRNVFNPVKRVSIEGQSFKDLKIFLYSDIQTDYEPMEVKKDEFDLVLTLGDIDEKMIDFILLQSKVPVYGVYGNHDPKEIPGLRILDGLVLKIKGHTISGVSGVPSDSHLQTSHASSEKDVWRKLKKVGRVDVLIAHSPPFSTSVNEGPAHRGFKAFDRYIEEYAPKYLIHGHLGQKYKTQIKNTTVMGIVLRDYLKVEQDNNDQR